MTFVPAYLRLSAHEFQEKAERAEAILKQCTLCPRNCRVDRTSGEKGFCRTGHKPFVSSYGPHFWEEKPLVGRFGSGTIFFSNCSLGCIFCQNWTISHLGEGRETSFERVADMMLVLQLQGCHNINLVTPTHQMPMILRCLLIAAGRGVNILIVYNCGGYESVEALRILNGIIDIYMPDFKYSDPAMGLKFSHAKDYPERARDAIREMHRQVGDLLIDRNGIAQRGLLVRHLVLPEGIAGTREVVRFLAEEISTDTYLNIMDQYYPCYKAFEHPQLSRRITKKEYSDAVRMALEAGLKRLNVQY